MSAFSVTTERTGDVLVLRAAGRMTLGDGTQVLQEAVGKLVADGAPKIVLDLGTVGYVDSAGLGGIVSAFSSVRSSGGTLVLASLPKRIRDLLQITKLLSVFETYETADDAVAHLSSTPKA